jgi:hypothetical protein
MNINQYIEIKPERRFGKPVIKGTRIFVADVLKWLANGIRSRLSYVVQFAHQPYTNTQRNLENSNL